MVEQALVYLWISSSTVVWICSYRATDYTSSSHSSASFYLRFISSEITQIKYSEVQVWQCNLKSNASSGVFKYISWSSLAGLVCRHGDSSVGDIIWSKNTSANEDCEKQLKDPREKPVNGPWVKIILFSGIFMVRHQCNFQV